MKFTHLFPLFVLAAMAGCASPANNTPSPQTRMTSQQKIEKIQNDPKIPDGLKQIQINTLQHQLGTKP